MKNKCILITGLIVLLASCSAKVYPTNGETIYKTGRNLNGERLLDKDHSRIRLVKSCQGCHGKNGTAMKGVSITFNDLNKLNTPYTDSLFFRFLDHDLKSDGSKANIGVIWKMNDADKRDLLTYLKTLR